MSEQDQNSPENTRDSKEGESPENADIESGSAPENARDSAGNNLPPDDTNGETADEEPGANVSGCVPLPEDEGNRAEPERGSSTADEGQGETVREEAAEEISSNAPDRDESGLHDEGEEVPDEGHVPVEEDQNETPCAGEVEENATPAPMSGDERPAENGEEAAAVIESEGETETTSGRESDREEPGASLEGVGEITGADEAEGSEESLRREEVVDDLAHIIESIVFASDEPLPVSTIKSVLDAARTFGRVNPDTITGRITALNAKYDEEGSGFRIVEIANGYQYATRKEMAQWVSNLFKERSKRRLSNSALETVAIIAYKQPITKPEIESIRGVSVDYVLHNLLEKELVTVVGRAETVGRPLLYGTTQKFLKIFALKNLEDLPKLREIEEIIKEIKNKGAEESIQLEITALGDSSAPEQENKPGESSENGAE